MHQPFPVAMVRTPQNGAAIAALCAVLEQELPGDACRPVILRDAALFDGRGLLVQSFLSARAERVAREMAELRERGQEPFAIAGGPHPSGRPEETRAMGFRWVAVGEAGASFADLVRQLASGEIPPAGIIEPSSRLPLDHYPPWPVSGQVFSAIELTRGCPIACAFCQTPALHGHRPRHRSLPALERAFRQAVATGHSFTRFISPNAFGYGSSDGRRGDRRALERVLLAARRAGMQRLYLGSFPSEVRPESVTPELLQLIRDHCANKGMVVGLQSGSDETLRRLRRGHTVEEGIKAVAMIAAAGLQPLVDFIFGLPGEDDADRAATLGLIEHLVRAYGVRVNTHLFTPLPGTALEDSPAAPVDAATRELVSRFLGQGRANKPLSDFGTGLVRTFGQSGGPAATDRDSEPPDPAIRRATGAGRPPDGAVAPYDSTLRRGTDGLCGGSEPRSATARLSGRGGR